LNELDAFDDAEIKVGIVALNAIKFTSFVPVGPKGRWEVADTLELSNIITKGGALPMAYKLSSSKIKYVSAVIAIGLNENPNKPGIIMEYAGKGIHEDELKKIAIESLKKAFSRRKKYRWKLKKIIIKKVGIQPKNGKTVCALVGALYIPNNIT